MMPRKTRHNDACSFYRFREAAEVNDAWKCTDGVAYFFLSLSFSPRTRTFLQGRSLVRQTCNN